MADFQYELIAQYYAIYSPVLWLLYCTIVVRIFTNTRESHFLNLVAMNGISDMTLCLLGNFFYRWPRNGMFHETIYQKLQTYSALLSFLYYLLFYLPYAEFISTCFMAFNSFTSMVIPKYYSLMWQDCFYKYVLAFIILPIFLFSNVLFSQSRFHYVESTQQYLLFTSSLIPQYVSRETGTAILTTILALTVLLFLLCLMMISMHLIKELEEKLERYQLEEMCIGILYTGLRSIFLYYELMINSYTEANDRTAIYRAGNLFPFANDIITLLPPIFLLACSSQIRQLVIPRFGQKKNRVHFAENVNEVRNTSGDHVGTDEEHHVNPEPRVNSTEYEEITHEKIVSKETTVKTETNKHVKESEHQQIIGHSLELDSSKLDPKIYPGYREMRRTSTFDVDETNDQTVNHELNETVNHELNEVNEDEPIDNMQSTSSHQQTDEAKKAEN